LKNGLGLNFLQHEQRGKRAGRKNRMDKRMNEMKKKKVMLMVTPLKNFINELS